MLMYNRSSDIRYTSFFLPFAFGVYGGLHAGIRTWIALLLIGIKRRSRGDVL
jgi:hypothetical protein